MEMEESREGVDWHSDGGEIPVWLAVLLMVVIFAPAGAALALIVILAIAR